MCSCGYQLGEHKQKLHIAYLLSWPKSIFDYKLRTVETKILSLQPVSTQNLLVLIKKSVWNKFIKSAVKMGILSKKPY